MKKILLATLGVFIVLGSGAYVFLIHPLLSPSEETPFAEAVLAKPDVVLLTGLNVRQMAFLERWFLGGPIVPVAEDVSGRTPQDRTLVDHLRAVSVEPRRDIDYALYALYPSDGGALRHAIMLVGRFSPGPINDYLARALGGVPRPGAGRISYEITIVDPNSCRPAATGIVTVDPKWILLADPASHAALLPRLASARAGGGGELAWWRPLARADVLSIGVSNLQDAEKAVPQPFLKASAKAATAEADVFQRFYLGVGAKPVPPEGRLRIVLDAADPNRAVEKIKMWEQAIGQSRARWADAMPTVATLYDSLTVRSDGGRSTIEFTVDRKLAANLQRVGNELLAGLFGGLGGRTTSPGAAPRVERIDSSPAAFEPSAAPTALRGYDPAAQFAEEVEETRGPFGVRLGALRLGSEPEVGLEVVVEGFTGAIPNVTGEQPRARLFVGSVKSAKGQELMRVEACGRERNSEPAPFAASFSRRLRATKTVRLIAGSDPHALQSVSGRVEIRLPTRTETLSAARPAPGTVLASHGATFTLTKVDGGSVSYQITGARDNVLHFRALNAAGQPLAPEGGFSADFLLGGGVAGQKDYTGLVDRVEVVFAAAEETVEFPFTLTDFSLAGKAGAVVVDPTPPFQPYSAAALRREPPPPPPLATPDTSLARIQLDPFELSLDKAQAFFVTRLDFTLRGPAAPNFQKAFSVGRLRLTRVDLKDGSTLEPPMADAASTGQSIGRPIWDTPIRFGSAGKDGALTTALYLLIDPRAKPGELKALRGVLTIQFPKTLQTLRLDDLSPGQHAELADLSVRVVGRTRKGLTLGINKDGNRVVYARLLNTEGQAIAFFGPQITESLDGAWRFELSPFSPPARAEVILAGELERKEYAFTLKAK